MPASLMRPHERTIEPPIAQALDVTYYQHERYLGPARRSRALTAYYALKPLIPAVVRLALRRAYARRQAARRFPAWPIEPLLVEHQYDVYRQSLRRSGAETLPVLAHWPEGRDAAIVLTHDVEGPAGVENIERVRNVERRHGFVSCWNFVAEGYRIPAGTFECLQADGCEIGVHGIKHDGKLFQNRSSFEANLPKIRAALERWDAVGFRSPATHRRAEWMHELGSDYDSSYPDTDPFEPQPGGCCSILPFFFGDVVELPITLVQDHTLWEILRQDSIDLWVRKSRWLISHHGLVNHLSHPDYLIGDARLAMYDAFLAFLREQIDCWHALPREVAAWWRARRNMHCEQIAGSSARIVGDVDDRAAVAWIREQAGLVVMETR